MQRLKMSMILLLITCLSCNTYAPINDLVQCSPLITLMEENDRRYIDEDNSTCTCRMYRYTIDYVGPVGDIWNEDLLYCNKLVGNTPDEYGELSIWFEKDRLIHNKIQNKTKR